MLPSFMTIVFDVLGFIVVHRLSRGLRGELREVSQDGSGYLRSVPEKFNFPGPTRLAAQNPAKDDPAKDNAPRISHVDISMDILSIRSELYVQAFYLDIVKINFSPLGKVDGNIPLHNKPPVRSLPLAIQIVKFQVEIPENLRNNFIDFL